QRRDAARVRQSQQRIRVFRARGRAARRRTRRLVVDVVVRRRLQLSRRAARGGMNAATHEPRITAGWPRVVLPEILDSLPPDDPRAIRSRGDLRRINRLMGSLGWLLRALDALVREPPT